MRSNFFPAKRALRVLMLLSACLYIFPLLGQDQIRKEGADPLQGKRVVDTARISELLKKSGDLRRSKPDSSIALAIQAIELSEEGNYELGKAEGFINIGLVRDDKGDFDEALRNYNLALTIYSNQSDTLGLSRVQNNIGSVYQTVGDNIKALEFFIKSLRNGEVVNDHVRIGTAYVNIGTVYSNDENTYDQAIENYQKSIAYWNELDEADALWPLSVVNYNIGEIYILKGQPEESLSFLNEALEGWREVGYDPATPLNLLGRAYLDMKQYERAYQYFEEALSSALENDTKGEQALAYIGLGNTLAGQGNPGPAIDFYEQGLVIAEQIGTLKEQSEAWKGLSLAYAETNDFQKAFSAQRNYNVVQDSIRSEEYINTMSNLRTSFDLERKEREIDLLNAENELKELQIEQSQRNEQLYLIIMGLFLAIIAGFVFQYFYIRRTNKRLAFERNRSDQILLNILPKETADELKEKGYVEAQEFKQITVLFTDFKAFSLITERISAERLVKSVDYYFKNFDEITERNNLEKIKTIGDAYMCAGGLPSPNNTHVRDAYKAAFEILHFVKETEMNPPKGIYPFQIRIGLNSGPVVAGVVGTKKFAYDIWGNTVNIAARMESGSETGRINVSESIYQELKSEHRFTYRGELKVKNQVFKMYFAEEDEEEAA
jgi:adenylate cyclase